MPMREIYSLRIWRKSLKDLVTFARTINKHLAFSGNWSEFKKNCFNMSFGDKAEQRTYKHLCVEIGKSLLETKQLLERHLVVGSVSRTLVYRWLSFFPRRFLGQLSSKMTVRHTVITEVWHWTCWIPYKMALANCEGCCTAKQHRSRICTYDIYRTYVYDKCIWSAFD